MNHHEHLWFFDWRSGNKNGNGNNINGYYYFINNRKFKFLLIYLKNKIL